MTPTLRSDAHQTPSIVNNVKLHGQRHNKLWMRDFFVCGEEVHVHSPQSRSSPVSGLPSSERQSFEDLLETDEDEAENASG